MTKTASADNDATRAANGRPDFLVRLGILLPCTTEDVETAYREHAKKAHPDRGGSVAAFTQLQADYEAATEFARFRASRRGWLATSIERYAQQEEIIAEIRRRGGSVDLQSTEWMAREIGPDFAQVLDRVVGIHWTDPHVNIDDIRFLTQHAAALSTLKRLDLSGARIGNSAIKELQVFKNLHELRLGGTSVGVGSVSTLGQMTQLTRLDITDTFIGWFNTFRLRRMLPETEIITQHEDRAVRDSRRRAYRIIVRLFILYIMVVFTATHWPGDKLPKIPTTRIELDKIAHFCIYFGLAFLLACLMSLRDADRRQHRIGISWTMLFCIWLVLAVVGYIDEYTQKWTGRSYSLNDWAADLSGITAGLIAFSIMQLFRRRKHDDARENRAVAF
ncbi:MAG: VanZ family protein [Planctomycetota bacterium]|nr:VanZ family protein [Planctomycetota bacterium]